MNVVFEHYGISGFKYQALKGTTLKDLECQYKNTMQRKTSGLIGMNYKTREVWALKTLMRRMAGSEKHFFEYLKAVLICVLCGAVIGFSVGFVWVLGQMWVAVK